MPDNEDGDFKNPHQGHRCKQCDLCEKCRRSYKSKTKMDEISDAEIIEQTCNNCGYQVKCSQNCQICPKCSQPYAEKKNALQQKNISVLPQNNESDIQELEKVKKILEQKSQCQKVVAQYNWVPSHIDPAKHPLIPFPHPPPSVELRAGQVLQKCWCLRRNGLQSDCPKTGCQGNKACMQYLVPACVPSGFGIADPKISFFQKADDPECYSKSELLKKKITSAVQAHADITAEDSEKIPPKKNFTGAIESFREFTDDSLTKKPIRLIPNEPPDYISDPPVNDYKAPCRRHGKHGVPGSAKYRHLKKYNKTKSREKNKIYPEKNKKDISSCLLNDASK